MGDAALLVELPDLEAALALAMVLTDDPAPGQVDVVPGARTVLVRCEPEFDPAAATAHIRAATPRGPLRPAAEVVIDTRYDGADLEEVGHLTGLGAVGVVAAHTASNWTVAFAGFAPGFGYLTGGDDRLRVPRRTIPGNRCGPDRWRWPGSSAASTRGSRPAGGS